MACVNKTQYTSTRNQGFTLIEVLIAMLVLSIGLLGLGAMQMTAVNTASNAHLKSVANFLAYDMADRMRANRDRTLAGGYKISIGETVAMGNDCLSTVCTPDDLVKFDKDEWKDDLAARLPGGDGSVAIVNGEGLNRYEIQVQWIESYNRTTDEVIYDTLSFQTEM